MALMLSTLGHKCSWRELNIIRAEKQTLVYIIKFTSRRTQSTKHYLRDSVLRCPHVNIQICARLYIWKNKY